LRVHAGHTGAHNPRKTHGMSPVSNSTGDSQTDPACAKL
jgi:hypothetical protein